MDEVSSAAVDQEVNETVDRWEGLRQARNPCSWPERRRKKGTGRRRVAGRTFREGTFLKRECGDTCRPDSTWLAAAGGNDRTVRIWDRPPAPVPR